MLYGILKKKSLKPLYIKRLFPNFRAEVHIESMKTACLVDQRRRGDGNDPFLEADRRERARKEAAAKRAHPTLHHLSKSSNTLL